MISLGNYPGGKMTELNKTESSGLLTSQRFRSAKTELMSAIAESSARVRKVKAASSPEARESYSKAISEFQKERGRDLYYPYLSSGIGCGPYVELADGSVKL